MNVQRGPSGWRRPAGIRLPRPGETNWTTHGACVMQSLRASMPVESWVNPPATPQALCRASWRRVMYSIPMAKNIKKRSDDYAQWYLDVIKAGKLADYAPVKGCM